MTFKQFWVGWIFGVMFFQMITIKLNDERAYKVLQILFNIGLMGFFLS